MTQSGETIGEFRESLSLHLVRRGNGAEKEKYIERGRKRDKGSVCLMHVRTFVRESERESYEEKEIMRATRRMRRADRRRR